MPGNDIQYLRNLKSGVPLFLRMFGKSGTWHRVEGINEKYFKEDVGERIDDEFEKQKQQIEAKYGRKVGRTVIERGFHTSDGDMTEHASISYEDEQGAHLSSRHVAQERQEQKKSNESNHTKQTK